MAAIAEELVFREKPRLKVDDDAPEVSVALGPAGRETLALIAEDACPPAHSRERLSTLDYGDRGRESVRRLLDEGFERGIIPNRVAVEFVGEKAAAG